MRASRMQPHINAFQRLHFQHHCGKSLFKMRTLFCFAAAAAHMLLEQTLWRVRAHLSVHERAGRYAAVAEPCLALMDSALLRAALGRGQAQDGEALQVTQVAGGVQGQPLLQLPHCLARRPAGAAHSASDCTLRM